MASHELIALSNTTATALTPVHTHSGIDITIQNVNSEGYVYIGASNLTSSNYGFRIDPSHAISIELNGKDVIYAIGSTSGLSVAVLSTSLEQGQ